MPIKRKCANMPDGHGDEQHDYKCRAIMSTCPIHIGMNGKPNKHEHSSVRKNTKTNPAFGFSTITLVTELPHYILINFETFNSIEQNISTFYPYEWTFGFERAMKP